MGELLGLPNVGKVLEKLLIDSGINTGEQLKNMGAEEAFVRIRLQDPTACIRMLYGLQGAIEGVKDTTLSDATKEKLKHFYNSL